uniref:Testis-expressed protein 101 n=1 Tax=Rattus norvegicus TaxID=10116 RepID=TX101_RAT|nr:RecName: Full=Testis-expressed protein 101; AltName: Full=Lipid raft-associated glycoprotein TEC-21; Flags: Precursor [Rattus norvegicus]AAK58911.1 glycoprotein TEC-21 [Rattus norvegicus]|eukprot:NP_620606.1 testis-expressed protein 101 precursor [Rattus norvegicus]
MGACRIQYILLVFLLIASHWTLVQNIYCEVSRTLSLEDNPSGTFNWTSKAEKCNPGEFCQETVLLIKAEGTKTAILASKSCVPQGAETMTFVQYTAPPGLVAISYSNYCNDSLCNNRNNLASILQAPEPTATSNMSGARHCPTCLALEPCSSAPSMPCANGTTQCYHGKIELSGGGMDSVVHVKGCTTAIGCRLMAKMESVGPMTVKETCSYQSFLHPRMAEIGASWMPTSLWVLELLLPALSLPLIYFP